MDVGALCDFVAEDYAAGETVPLLPARFAVPLMHGAPGTLDGVSTLDDAAALAQQYAPRPGGQSWAALADDQRYAFGFDSVESLVRFALQTSQPALLADGALDNAALRSLLGFVQTVGGYYGMAAYPAAEPNGSAGQFGGEDVLFWEAGMTEYAMAERAAFGFGNMITPSWLGATSPEQTPDGQTILQPGLCRGVYLPCCFAAVNAGSNRQEAALAFVGVLFGDAVQGGYQRDGLPVTEAGIRACLDRNREALQEKGYTGGFEQMLARLETPVILDDALLDSLTVHATAMIGGGETLDAAAAGVQADLALHFAEQG